MSDRVHMWHPDLPDAPPVPMPRRSFDRVWSLQGWLEVGDEPVTETLSEEKEEDES